MTSENVPDSHKVRRSVTRGQVQRYPLIQTAREISLDVIVIEYRKMLKAVQDKLNKKKDTTDNSKK